MKANVVWVLGLFLVGFLAGCFGEELSGTKCDGNATCNNHGACKDTSGSIVCKCDQGYNQADKCGTCATGYKDYGDSTCKTEDPCASDTTCAGQNKKCNNDNGTATCSDKCLSGYHKDGSNCVIDTSCQGTTCNNHGTCNPADLTCSNCDAGYTGDHCDKCSDAKGPCGKYATCSDSGGNVSCICQAGAKKPDCNECADGYKDNGDNVCNIFDPCTSDTTCANQHKKCVLINGVVTCGDCVDGYTGPNCETPPQTCTPDPCNGHGECTANNDGTVTCNCKKEYNSQDNCKTCANNYGLYNSSCVSCTDSNPCPDNSSCGINNGAIECNCNDGYKKLTDGSCCKLKCSGTMSLNETCDDGCGSACECKSGLSCVGGYCKCPNDFCNSTPTESFCDNEGKIHQCYKSSEGCYYEYSQYCGASPELWICKNNKCLLKEQCNDGIDNDEDGNTDDIDGTTGKKCSCAVAYFYNFNNVQLFDTRIIVNETLDVWWIGDSYYRNNGDLYFINSDPNDKNSYNDIAYYAKIDCFNSKGTITLTGYDDAKPLPKDRKSSYTSTFSCSTGASATLQTTSRDKDGYMKFGMSSFTLKCEY